MSDIIHSLDDFLLLLKGVKSGKAGQYTALCPGHDDRNRSLSVKQADGKLLVKCFAGCDTADILKPLNLEPKDLFLNSRKTKSEHREVEAVYHYTDANEKPFEVVRFKGKDFRQRQPDGKGGYIWNLNGILPTLYHQDDLKSAILHGDMIFITEGEKDCDNLWKIGLIATTNTGGAGKWRPSYSQTLRGASVVILSDKDEAGRKHGQQIAASLYGIAKTVKVVELLGDNLKDVSDWLEASGDDIQLLSLVENTPDWQPEVGPSSVILRRIADVEPETVKWLWQPYIPYAKLTLLEGDPGTGKSWCGLAIATAQSLEKGLPSIDSLQAGNVLIISAEDGLSDTIRPRLSAFEADINRIYAIDGLFTLDKDGCETLEGYIQQLNPLLVIIDPLVAYLSGEVDVHKANMVRQVTAHLARLADRYNTAIVCVRHLTKGGSNKAIYRGLGSIDFTASARSVLLAGFDPDDPLSRGFCHIKSNLAKEGEPVGFQITDEGFFWTETCSLTVEQIMSPDASGSLQDAVTFLNDLLNDGPMDASTVLKEADNRGIKRATLYRTKAAAGVKSIRCGEAGKKGGGKFTWELGTADEK